MRDSSLRDDTYRRRATRLAPTHTVADVTWLSPQE
jgi:hypothetical protein